jgi:hypothetical protein
MEPEGSVPHSQELSSCPYPEPDPLHLYRIHPTTYVLVFLVASFPLQPIRIPLLPHSGYMPRPSHPRRIHYSSTSWRRVQAAFLPNDTES